MLVSCIVPTYKKLEYLYGTLDSILEQDYSDIELIITDDATENFPKDDIYLYIEKNKKGNIRNHFILTHENNVGTVKNMNDAIMKCNGEIIVPLASDDQFFNKTVISDIVKTFVNSGCTILSCSRMKCSEDMIKHIRKMPHPGYYWIINKFINTADKQFKAMALGSSFEFASGASMYYTAEFMKSRNGYDESYTLWEDGPFITQATFSDIKVETNYDLISVLYREGGISSKKKTIPPKIQKDYIRLIENEFLGHRERFNMIEYRIIKGRKSLQMNEKKMTIGLCIKYPETMIYNGIIKIIKLISRYGH